jgi:hypothetical protein
LSRVASRNATARRLRILLCAVVIAVPAFLLRFNSLSGSLGGFTNDQFVSLSRVEMILQGEQPLRDFADAEMRGAWPALSYQASTWAQQVGGHTLLPEAYLTVTAVVVSQIVVFALVWAISKRWWLGGLAAALCIVSMPRLYSYPKVLMLALGLAAMRALMTSPSRWRLALAALVTAIAALFRHDIGGYLAVGIIAGLVGRVAGSWTLTGRHVGIYLGFTALFLAPSAIWVQVYEGIPSYIRSNLEVSALEAGRSELVNLPIPTLSTLFTNTILEVLVYWGFWAVAFFATIVLVSRILARSGRALTPEERGFSIGLLLLGIVSIRLLVREPLDARLSDAAVPIAVLGAWTVTLGQMLAVPLARRLVTLGVSLLLVCMAAASWVFMGMGSTLTDSGLTSSPKRVAEEYSRVRQNLQRLPPIDWSNVEATGSMTAARYVAECTTPDDYLLSIGDTPEVTVFARRRFAAGQGVFAKGWYTSEAEQRKAIARLASQSAPIMLADAGSFESDFVPRYPLVARHVATHYRRVGEIPDESRPLLVFVDVAREPRSTERHFGFPCFR